MLQLSGEDEVKLMALESTAGCCEQKHICTAAFQETPFCLSGEDLAVWNTEKGKEQSHWDPLFPTALPSAVGFVTRQCLGDTPCVVTQGRGKH